MNPFAEYAQNMKAYEGFCSEPVANTGNENTIATSTGSYPAIVGQFVRRDILISGGISMHLVGEAIVQKSALPANTSFALGQTITAYPIGGGAHQCQVFGVDNTFTEWRLQLMDASEGA